MIYRKWEISCSVNYKNYKKKLENRALAVNYKPFDLKVIVDKELHEYLVSVCTTSGQLLLGMTGCVNAEQFSSSFRCLHGALVNLEYAL